MSEALYFTVEGEFITNFAREKLFIDKNLASAIKLLRSSLMTDQLTSDEQLMLCLQILNGDASIVGNSGTKDYGVEYRDDIEENPTNLESIAQMIADMAEHIARLKEENRSLIQRVNFLGSQFSDYRLERINADYYNEEGEPLFPDIPIPEWRKNENQYTESNSMLDSFLAQRRREQEAEEKGEDVCDYGWLEPDGTWHPVPWGMHGKWAGEWLNEHMPYKTHPKIYWHIHEDGTRHHIVNGDVLIYSLGWILLDNPYQGIAKVRKDPNREMTKEQKEFLFDYFTERGRMEEANALYQD